MKKTGDIEFNQENFRLLLSRNQELSAQIESLKKVFTELQSKYQLTKDDLDYLKRQLYGRKSERFLPQDPGQLTLELEQMAKDLQEQQTTQNVAYERKTARKERKPDSGRQPLPAHLRREETIIEPENLPQGSIKIGEEITEILEYKKAEIYVKKFVRPKYALPEKDGVKIGDLPLLPIPKGNAGPSLIAHILIGKYIDHLPLSRQQKQFRRLGVEISEKTIGGWVAAGANLLTTLYERLMFKVQRSGYLGPAEKVRSASDSTCQSETVY